MVKVKQVLQTPTFKKAVKKLKPNQKQDLDNAIKELIDAPLLGEQKKGDLSFYRLLVHDKIIQPIPQEQISQLAMKHRLAIWASKLD